MSDLVGAQIVGFLTYRLKCFFQALRHLGIEPTAEQEAEMMSKLRIDPVGTVNYGGMTEIFLHPEFEVTNFFHACLN